VARPGQGRRGGYRTLIAYRAGDIAVFLFGFAKSERGNIDDDDLADLRGVSASWLAADANRIDLALAKGLLIEVEHDD